MKERQKLNLQEIIVGKHFYADYCFEEDGKYLIHVIPSRRTCTCPQCGRKSNTIISSYERTIQDIPLRNMPTYQKVVIHRFRCSNPYCSRKTFSEPLTIAGPRRVRSRSLDFMILDFSIFVSDLASSHMLSNIGVDVSHDTIQRLYDNIDYYDDPNVESVGIDDVSLKKGRHYATVIYDLKDHHLLALLDGRDGRLLKPWLEEHKNIKVVARDRDSALAKVINEVLPNCKQVSDRFHLIHGMINYLDKRVRSKIPMHFFIKNNELLDKTPHKIKADTDLNISDHELELLQCLNYDNTFPLDNSGNPITFDNKWRNSHSLRERMRAARRLTKKNMIEEIQSNHSLNDVNLKDVSKSYGLSEVTLYHYLKMNYKKVEKLDKPAFQPKRKTVIDDYVNIIFKMMKDGQTDRTIFLYVISKGYKHNHETLWSYIYNISKNNFPSRVTESADYRIRRRDFSKDVSVINREGLFKMIFEDKSNITKKNPTIELIKSKYPIIDQASQIYKEYHNAIMGNDVNAIDEFIDKYNSSMISGFCNHLKRDIIAIHRTISSPISSGFVEGNNNKLKLIEQIVFHKSKIINLFKKCYLAFMVTDSNIDLKELWI